MAGINDSCRDEAVNDLATHLPDQVVYVDHNKQLPFQKTNQGVLMFLDISGFTSLTEKYSMNSRSGTDQLTKTLNGYMEALVGEIISNDGDILKFAGDAILTLWQVDNFMMMKVTVAHVIKCALSVQRKYGSWTTGVGVKLKIKIAVSAGEVMVTYLGNNEFRHYVTMGRAVESVKAAEKFCNSGDIVIAPSVWCHCAGLPLEKEMLSDQKHIKVTQLYGASIADDYEPVRTEIVSESRANLLGVSSPADPQAGCTMPKRSQRDLTREKSNTQLQESDTEDKSKKEFPATQKTMTMTGAMKKFGTSLAGAAKKNLLGVETANDFTAGGILSEQFIARIAISKQVQQNATDNSRLYVAPAVLKKIDEQQPLEYLSEMRQVTIVFINLQMKDCNKLELCQTLQKAFTTIYYHIKRLQGCLNKIFMFDKGCTFLGIFGLPGFKNEKDCMHALLCAYRMKQQLDEIPKLAQSSIGVTTGSSFCGVVGHSHRHEYTVIGRKVNIAARLMMHYPGKVTCDNDTFHHSKLHKSNFFTLENKEMKGLQNIGTIREFIETIGDKGTMAALKQKEFENPLIGREEEMKLFLQHLEHLKGEKMTERLAVKSQVVVIDGEAGIGKSRMLEAIMVNALDMDVKVVSCTLSMTESRTPFYAVKNLMMELLDFDLEILHQEREQSLYKRFKDPFVVENMCLLNDLLHIKLPQNEKFKSMDGKERSSWLQQLLLHIVHELTNTIGVIMFAVDDAHFMDPESWKFISILGNDNKSMVCLTLKTGSVDNVCPVAQEILKLSTTVHLHISGLQKNFMTALACQRMGVQKIPQRLEVFLQEKSHGVPSWCSQMLQELMHEDILDICPVKSGFTSDETMVCPPSHYMNRRRRTSREVYSDMGKEVTDKVPSTNFNEELYSGQTDPTTLICIIKPGCSLDRSIPDSVKGMIQARIDRMDELEQLIIKSAAVLGNSFSRDMLHSVVPSKGEQIPEEHFSRALHKLLSSGIFHCGIGFRLHGSKQLLSLLREKKDEECACPEDPYYSKGKNCRLLIFQSSSLQETAYDILLEDLRKNMHKKAAVYLERQAHKCEACGGGGFFPEHMVESLVTLESNSSEAVVSDKPKHLSHRRISLWKTAPNRIKRTITSVGEVGDETTFPQQSSPPSKQDSFALANITTAARPSVATGNARRGSLFAHAMESAFKARQQTSLGPQAEEKLDKVFSCDSGDSIADSYCQLDSIDLRECECMQILSCVYPQLVRHWRAAGSVRQTVHFLMEASAAAIAVQDNMQALSYLRDVGKIIEDMKKNKNPFEEVSGAELFTMSQWEETRMESLIGQALFQMGQMEESLPHFNNTLSILGHKQPRSTLSVWYCIAREGFRQWRQNTSPITHTDRLPKLNLFEDRKGILLVHRKMEVARCLSYMFHYFLFTNDDQRALACVLQQINCSEEANADLHELLIGYTCMMEFCQVKAWIGIGRLYEYKALLRCMSSMDRMTPEHLGAISHLYRTSVNMRLSWGFIGDAIDSGYTANRITQKLHDNDVRIHVLPVLIQALLLANRVMDSINVLQELEFLLRESKDIIGQAWYYTGYFDLPLDYGVYLENHDDCMQFVKENYNSPKFISDHLPVYYLSACLTLWHTRRKEWAVADKWRCVCAENKPSGLHNYMAVRGFMKLLEATLIRLSYETYCKSRLAKRQLKKVYKKDMSELKNILSHLPVVEPRYLHLQAYYHALGGHMIKADYLLNRCLSLSKRENNLLELQWASHSLDMWFVPITSDNFNLWYQISMSNNKMDCRIAEKPEGSSVMYALPMPSWYDM